MSGKIFISYRRDDSADQVHGIAQYLERAIGRNQVFLDVDMISGTNFPRELEKRLAECKVLLALIGPGWLDAKDDKGKRRLDNTDDWVRLEIGRALSRGIAVIPVRVGGAKLPERAALPDDIKGLLDHQAARVSAESFRNDVAGLARDIAAISGDTRPGVPITVAACVLLAFVGISYGLWEWRRSGSSPGPSRNPNVSASAVANSSPKDQAVEATQTRPVSAADILAHCVKDQRHPYGADIVDNLVTKFRSRTFRYGWTAESTATEQKSGTVWHDIIEATVSDGALQLRIPWRNGRLRLVPVVKQRFSTRGIAGVSLVVQGMWGQDNGYGCIELTFDDDGAARGAIGVMDASRLDTQAFIERVY